MRLSDLPPREQERYSTAGRGPTATFSIPGGAMTRAGSGAAGLMPALRAGRWRAILPRSAPRT
jgi:hypothetical protein